MATNSKFKKQRDENDGTSFQKCLLTGDGTAKKEMGKASFDRGRNNDEMIGTGNNLRYILGIRYLKIKLVNAIKYGVCVCMMSLNGIC